MKLRDHAGGKQQDPSKEQNKQCAASLFRSYLGLGVAAGPQKRFEKFAGRPEPGVGKNKKRKIGAPRAMRG